jgi:hypothetical protein
MSVYVTDKSRNHCDNNNADEYRNGNQKSIYKGER